MSPKAAEEINEHGASNSTVAAYSDEFRTVCNASKPLGFEIREEQGQMKLHTSSMIVLGTRAEIQLPLHCFFVGPGDVGVGGGWSKEVVPASLVRISTCFVNDGHC